MLRSGGKTALITGGTTGIGRATAELLHAAGVRVAVTGQNPDTLAAARRELPQDIAVIEADARSLSDASRLAAEVEQRFGKLDVLFLNAGIAQLAPFEAVDEAFYDEHMNVNVKGVVFTLQKLLPNMSAGSSVMLNTSVADQRGAKMMSIYSASKGAVAALVRAVRLTSRARRSDRRSLHRAHSPRPLRQRRRSRERRRVLGVTRRLLHQRRRAGRRRRPVDHLGVSLSLRRPRTSHSAHE